MLLHSQPTIPYAIRQPSGLAQAFNNEGYQEKITNRLVNSSQNCPLLFSKEAYPRPKVIKLAVKEWFDLMLLFIESQKVDCGVPSPDIGRKIKVGKQT